MGHKLSIFKKMPKKSKKKPKLQIIAILLLFLPFSKSSENDHGETSSKPVNYCEHPGCAICYPVLQSKDLTCLSCIDSKPILTKNGLHYCDYRKKPSVEHCYHINNDDKECLKCKRGYGLYTPDLTNPKYKVCRGLHI